MFPKWININVCHFLIHLLKMTSYNIYPPIPWGPETLGLEGSSALPEALGPRSVDVPPQVGYHLNVVQANRRGLKAEKQTFKKKYEKYTKILN